jgi:hypothetical protein
VVDAMFSDSREPALVTCVTRHTGARAAAWIAHS